MTAHTLTVALGERSYPILIGPGLLSNFDPIATHLHHRRIALVSNATVFPLYGATLQARAEAAGFEVHPIVLPDGEQYKTWETLNRIFDALLERSFDRKSTLIAFGGGVIGDLTGFAAATYQRGINFVQVPTTLLAQVDSSIGGKTAINHPRGKNMIGAFHQPVLVLADTDTLRTLPERELRAGLAEVIKYGLIRDPSFFDWLEANIDALLARDAAALAHAILRSCEIKATIVAEDERETGVRALLNLGHTFGHAIEAALGYGKWLHGEAVAAGMICAARLSQERGQMTALDVDRSTRLLQRTGLPVDLPAIAPKRMLDLMEVDKKNEGGRLRLVLMRGIGDAHVEADVTRPDLLSFLERSPPA